MREIKFRAWHPVGGYDRRSFEMTYWKLGTGLDNSVFFNSAEAVMQFTGLHDKNGKEIYEGDIVRNPNGSKSNAGIGVVEYVTHNSVGLTMTRFWARATADEAWSFSEQDEVIGNIYENPDLLS